jgi:hypothetical protein
MCPLPAGLLRDSFTMPKDEYKPLAEVKRACLKAGIELKKKRAAPSRCCIDAAYGSGKA